MRFVGVLNAAVWVGAAIFNTLVVAPAMASQEMHNLLRTSFPFFSVSIGQILAERFFLLSVICASIALLHLWADWLYLGRAAHRFWLWLLASLFVLSLAGTFWLAPELDRLHRDAYSAALKPEKRLAADRAFGAWHNAGHAINFLIMGGVTVYLWRVANPLDSLRILGAVKFRG